MMKEQFDFRQFSIEQDRCAMKVGTDGVLLGAWATLPHHGRILDIGTGTGLLALMAAQRTECHITGIEINAEAAQQAAENALRSPWSNRINIVCADIAHYVATTPFDAIVSNPPYYTSNLRSPDTARATARHQSWLNLPTLVQCAANLLTTNGQLHLVLPFDTEEDAVNAAILKGFYPMRRTIVLTRFSKPPRRVLLTFSRNNQKTDETTLILHANDTNERSPEYQKLIQDFYIR